MRFHAIPYLRAAGLILRYLSKRASIYDELDTAALYLIQTQLEPWNERTVRCRRRTNRGWHAAAAAKAGCWWLRPMTCDGRSQGCLSVMLTTD